MIFSLSLKKIAKQVTGLEPKQLLDWEPFILRCLFAATALDTYPFLKALSYNSSPYPSGLAVFFDLFILAHYSTALTALYWLSLLFYVGGFFLPACTAFLAIFCVVTGTIDNSQTLANHAFQIVPLLWGAQCAAYTWIYYKKSHQRVSEGHRISMILGSQIMVYVYMTAGITKLRSAGLDWIQGAPNLAIETAKAHAQIYYTYLQPEALERGNQMASLILEHPSITKIAVTGSLLLELFSFTGLFGKKMGLVIALLLTLFHLSVRFLMDLDFRLHQYFLLLFMGHAVFWALWLIQRITARRQST